MQKTLSKDETKVLTELQVIALVCEQGARKSELLQKRVKSAILSCRTKDAVGCLDSSIGITQKTTALSELITYAIADVRLNNDFSAALLNTATGLGVAEELLKMTDLPVVKEALKNLQREKAKDSQETPK